MTSERIQRRVERLLDQAEAAADERRWQDVLAFAKEVLSFDEANQDALAFVQSAERMSTTASAEREQDVEAASLTAPAALSTSFVNGRYEVKRFLGEGGKKRLPRPRHDARPQRSKSWESPRPTHSSSFDMNEDALPIGTAVMATTALRFLGNA